MSKEFQKKKTVELKIYPYWVTFLLLSKGFKLKSSTNESNSMVSAKTLIHEGSTSIFIYLTNNDVSTLVHECFHATSFIMNGIGAEAPTMLNETWAYLLGYLTKEGLEFLNK